MASPAEDPRDTATMATTTETTTTAAAAAAADTDTDTDLSDDAIAALVAAAEAFAEAPDAPKQLIDGYGKPIRWFAASSTSDATNTNATPSPPSSSPSAYTSSPPISATHLDTLRQSRTTRNPTLAALCTYFRRYTGGVTLASHLLFLKRYQTMYEHNPAWKLRKRFVVQGNGEFAAQVQRKEEEFERAGGGKRLRQLEWEIMRTREVLERWGAKMEEEEEEREEIWVPRVENAGDAATWSCEGDEGGDGVLYADTGAQTLPPGNAETYFECFGEWPELSSGVAGGRPVIGMGALGWYEPGKVEKAHEMRYGNAYRRNHARDTIETASSFSSSSSSSTSSPSSSDITTGKTKPQYTSSGFQTLIPEDCAKNLRIAKRTARFVLEKHREELEGSDSDSESASPNQSSPGHHKNKKIHPETNDSRILHSASCGAGYSANDSDAEPPLSVLWNVVGKDDDDENKVARKEVQVSVHDWSKDLEVEMPDSSKSSQSDTAATTPSPPANTKKRKPDEITSESAEGNKKKRKASDEASGDEREGKMRKTEEIQKDVSDLRKSARFAAVEAMSWQLAENKTKRKEIQTVMPDSERSPQCNAVGTTPLPSDNKKKRKATDDTTGHEQEGNKKRKADEVIDDDERKRQVMRNRIANAGGRGRKAKGMSTVVPRVDTAP